MNKKKHSKKEDEITIEKVDDASPQAGICEDILEDPITEDDPVVKLNHSLNELNDKYLRLHAEFQNYRKRVEKEKSDIYKFGNEKLFIEMLSIMDNFERAMNTIDSNVVDVKFIDGMNLIKKSFVDLFEKNGVKKINAMGEVFNHDLHHAVIKEHCEGTESEIIIEVLQDGYTMSDRVIRHSMVKVSE